MPCCPGLCCCLACRSHSWQSQRHLRRFIGVCSRFKWTANTRAVCGAPNQLRSTRLGSATHYGRSPAWADGGWPSHPWIRSNRVCPLLLRRPPPAVNRFVAGSNPARRFTHKLTHCRDPKKTENDEPRSYMGTLANGRSRGPCLTEPDVWAPVQRKVSNGVAGFAAARSSLDRHEIAAILAISAIDQHPRNKGC
jgi:hypothetical protein